MAEQKKVSEKSWIPPTRVSRIANIPGLKVLKGEVGSTIYIGGLATGLARQRAEWEAKNGKK